MKRDGKLQLKIELKTQQLFSYIEILMYLTFLSVYLFKSDEINSGLMMVSEI